MGRIRSLLTRVNELPSSAFGERPYIEFEIDSCLKLDGCREILSYSDKGAMFLTDMGIIRVGGEELELSSYGNSTVRVCGKIISVTVDGEGRKC